MLGPNGPGKTTTISIATTRALPPAEPCASRASTWLSHPACGGYWSCRSSIRSTVLTVYENLLTSTAAYFGFSPRARQIPIAGASDPVHALRAQRRLPAAVVRRPGAACADCPRHRATGRQSCFWTSERRPLTRKAAMAMWSAVRRASHRRYHGAADHALHGRGQLAQRPAGHHRLRTRCWPSGRPKSLKATSARTTIFNLKLRSLEGLERWQPS